MKKVHAAQILFLTLLVSSPLFATGPVKVELKPAPTESSVTIGSLRAFAQKGTPESFDKLRDDLGAYSTKWASAEFQTQLAGGVLKYVTNFVNSPNLDNVKKAALLDVVYHSPLAQVLPFLTRDEQRGLQEQYDAFKAHSNPEIVSRAKAWAEKLGLNKSATGATVAEVVASPARIEETAPAPTPAANGTANKAEIAVNLENVRIPTSDAPAKPALIESNGAEKNGVVPGAPVAESKPVSVIGVAGANPGPNEDLAARLEAGETINLTHDGSPVTFVVKGKTFQILSIAELAQHGVQDLLSEVGYCLVSAENPAQEFKGLRQGQTVIMNKEGASRLNFPSDFPQVEIYRGGNYFTLSKSHIPQDLPGSPLPLEPKGGSVSLRLAPRENGHASGNGAPLEEVIGRALAPGGDPGKGELSGGGERPKGGWIKKLFSGNGKSASMVNGSRKWINLAEKLRRGQARLDPAIESFIRDGENYFQIVPADNLRRKGLIVDDGAKFVLVHLPHPKVEITGDTPNLNKITRGIYANLKLDFQAICDRFKFPRSSPRPFGFIWDGRDLFLTPS